MVMLFLGRGDKGLAVGVALGTVLTCATTWTMGRLFGDPCRSVPLTSTLLAPTLRPEPKEQNDDKGEKCENDEEGGAYNHVLDVEQENDPKEPRKNQEKAKPPVVFLDFPNLFEGASARHLLSQTGSPVITSSCFHHL